MEKFTNYKKISDNLTKCTGAGCLLKTKCGRYEGGITNYFSTFAKPPFTNINNNFECIFFWGEKSENIFNQLKEILCREKEN
jgi:hypothetical protein